mgnify:CR=1 FL=1
MARKTISQATSEASNSDGGVIAVHRLLAGDRDVDAAFLNSLQHNNNQSAFSS